MQLVPNVSLLDMLKHFSHLVLGFWFFFLFSFYPTQTILTTGMKDAAVLTSTKGLLWFQAQPSLPSSAAAKRTHLPRVKIILMGERAASQTQRCEEHLLRLPIEQILSTDKMLHVSFLVIN